MKKKILTLLTGILCLSTCFAGCGSDQAKQIQKSSDKTEDDGAKRQTHEAVTISSFNRLVKKEFLDAFHQVYPEVELDVQSYSGMNGSGYSRLTLENGDIPDIYVTTQNFSKESQEKYLVDLSNYDFINQYSNTILDSLDVNGSIYLIPSGYQLMGIYYNKTILDENGWKVPNSFQELSALDKEIQAAGYRTMGNAMSLDGYPFNYFFNLGNTQYFGTPEGTAWKAGFPEGKEKAAGNEGLKRCVEYFNKWVEEGFISGEHMPLEQFMEGGCVFYLCLGISEYEHTAENGKTYQFGTMPWLSEDGSNNMVTRNVSGYMGIHKTLEEDGNEQKLEDALKVFQFISTAEGQRALMSGSSQYMSSLNEASLEEDSPYQELQTFVNEGRTVPMLYVGWEDLIIPIAQDIKLLIEGKIDAGELSGYFDETNEALRKGSSEDVYATIQEELTLEETARLIAIAEGMAVDADCAMISLNQYHGDNKSNNQGLGWKFYQGEVTLDLINIVCPRSDTISVLEMTGAEIKKMRQEGFDLDGDGNPYEYLLFTKDGELSDHTVYKLAVSTGELTEEMQKKAKETKHSPKEAIGQYLRRLKTVNLEKICWD